MINFLFGLLLGFVLSNIFYYILEVIDKNDRK
jgi:hypothetical protein